MSTEILLLVYDKKKNAESCYAVANSSAGRVLNADAYDDCLFLNKQLQKSSIILRMKILYFTPVIVTDVSS